jgi:mono/diheme cytochrome c family protein
MRLVYCAPAARFEWAIRPSKDPAMQRTFASACTAALVIGLSFCSQLQHAAAAEAVSARAPLSEPSFERDVRPILKAHCFQCHGEGEELQGKLDLRLRRLIAQGGESGAALVEGTPDESLIYERIKLGEMPPGDKKMPPEQVEKVRAWIAAGAKTARPEPEQITADTIMPEEREFWCFQPVMRPDRPTVKQADRVRSPIDAFVAARLEGAGMAFSPEADKQTLIRRATFDLLGLPPTPEEVAAFVAGGSVKGSGVILDGAGAAPVGCRHATTSARRATGLCLSRAESGRRPRAVVSLETGLRRLRTRFAGGQATFLDPAARLVRLAQPLASRSLAAEGRRIVGVHALADRHAHATLARRASHVRHGPALSRPLQIFSHRGRRSPAGGRAICGTQCAACEPGGACRRLALVELAETLPRRA